jgi:hypothetical protein
MGSPSAMGELLPFRQDGDNGGPLPASYSGVALERRGAALCEPVAGFGAAESHDSHSSGRACSGVILISIKSAASAAPGSAR